MRSKSHAPATISASDSPAPQAGWPPLIKMDGAVRKKINSLFGNAGDKF